MRRPGVSTMPGLRAFGRFRCGAQRGEMALPVVNKALEALGQTAKFAAECDRQKWG